MYDLSIIVPVYNVEKYLIKCIESILNQTFKGFELILVNDGSTDLSGNICDEYAEVHSNIKVIHKDNGGLSSARNAGIDIATGLYIAFVDSDDWIDENMYKNLVELAATKDYDIVACNFWTINDKGDIKRYNKFDLNMEFNRLDAIEEIFSNKILTFSACNKIYKANLFNDLRFTNGIIFEDMDICYKLLDKATYIYYISIPLYYYQYNSDSILRKSFSLKRLDLYKVQKEMYDFYNSNYKYLSDMVYFNLFNSSIGLYIQLINYDKHLVKKYKYLIQFDKNVLKRLLQNSKIEFKQKVRILLAIISPKVLLYFINIKIRIVKKLSK